MVRSSISCTTVVMVSAQLYSGMTKLRAGGIPACGCKHRVMGCGNPAAALRPRRLAELLPVQMIATRSDLWTERSLMTKISPGVDFMEPFRADAGSVVRLARRP